MQIGFNAPTTGPLIEPDSLVRIVTEGEALGFDYVTISDHIMVPRSLQSKYPYTGTGEFPAGASAAWLEQLTTAAFVAGLTKKLRFVLSVMVVPHRPAVLTAKVLSTIDHLSRGRLTLGIGVGWCREEFEAIGAAPFDDRGNVTDEWMAACQELWSAEAPKFAGKYVRFDDVVFTPKPVQKPVPIWVGGGKCAGAPSHHPLCPRLVSGRHQPAASDEHGLDLQAGAGTLPRFLRARRPRSEGDHARLSGPLRPRRAPPWEPLRRGRAVHRRRCRLGR
ncbi:MAG: TIGR03619 family F420-dependent LLM class oxidoreductase [Alphaproteobacteria bacterium]|nr:TIGR03619 family F420-dependent LLM class oxidoreductase [Alphaproteobacteria bacterium]